MIKNENMTEQNAKETDKINNKKNDKNDEEEKVLDEDGEEYTF